MCDWELIGSMIRDGLWDAFNGFRMGQTAENVTKKYRVFRGEQGELKTTSQQRAEEALRYARFKGEILPIAVRQKNGDAIQFVRDEGPRAGVATDGLASLKPMFTREGTVPAGNASGLNDGKGASVVSMVEKCEQLALERWRRLPAMPTLA